MNVTDADELNTVPALQLLLATLDEDTRDAAAVANTWAPEHMAASQLLLAHRLALGLYGSIPAARQALQSMMFAEALGEDVDDPPANDRPVSLLPALRCVLAGADGADTVQLDDADAATLTRSFVALVMGLGGTDPDGWVRYLRELAQAEEIDLMGRDDR